MAKAAHGLDWELKSAMNCVFENVHMCTFCRTLRLRRSWPTQVRDLGCGAWLRHFRKLAEAEQSRFAIGTG
jgi:hypothetical protein